MHVGVSKWTIRLDHIGDKSFFTIAIAPEKYDVYAPWFPGLGSAAGISLWAGLIYNNGDLSKRYCKLVTGDVVTMVIDNDARTMEFIVNGSSCGIAAQNIPRVEHFPSVHFFLGLEKENVVTIM